MSDVSVNWQWDVVCPECGQSFDLLDGVQAEEWYYGHDCEAL